MGVISKVDVRQVVASLRRPFSPLEIARVGEVMVSLYLCEGAVPWHKHTDVDELFWGIDGAPSIETETGPLQLHSGEVTVVPKGVEHRARAHGKAALMLMRCDVVTGGKNGRGRLYVDRGMQRLEAVSLEAMAGRLLRPFRFKDVVLFDDMMLQVAWGDGTWITQVPAEVSQLLYVVRGTMSVHTTTDSVHLHPGDLMVVPPHALYRLSTTKGTALARIARQGTQM